MPGLYSHTTRGVGTTLTANIYNSDHQNHIDNDTPSQMDDYSASVAQMQATTDPGEVGTESQPSSLAGELERIRFCLKELKGTPQWYETISAFLSDIVGDTTPQLGGDLDLNGYAIKDANGNTIIAFSPTAAADDHILIVNDTAAPRLEAAGGDTNIPMRLRGKGTGQVQIGDANLNYPDSDGSSGQSLVTDGAGNLSFSTIGWTLASEQATTTGTAKDFTSIPSGVNQIIVELDQVSIDAASDLLIQIGDSGGLETTGYSAAGHVSTAWASSSSGYIMRTNNAAASFTGHAILTRMTGNKWVCSHNGLYVGASGTGIMAGAGVKTLSAVLDRLRLTLVSGNFDNGSVALKYRA